jgi:hypothetical protein
MAGLRAEHLASPDLPGQIEVVGLKRAAAQFLGSTRTLVDWTMRRAKQRLQSTR